MLPGQHCWLYPRQIQIRPSLHQILTGPDAASISVRKSWCDARQPRLGQDSVVPNSRAGRRRATPYRGNPVSLRRPDREQPAAHPDSGGYGPRAIPRVVRPLPLPWPRKPPPRRFPLGEIPQGWEVAPLSSLVDFAKGRKPAETRPEPMPGDVKLLLIDSLNGGTPVYTSPAKLVLAEVSDTLMVMDGSGSCQVTIGASGAVGSTLGRFRTTRPTIFSVHALFRFLEAKTEEFKSKNIGAAIPHANKDYILTQPIALPPAAIASSFHDQIEPNPALD